jgi:hypothetical protein
MISGDGVQARLGGVKTTTGGLLVPVSADDDVPLSSAGGTVPRMGWLAWPQGQGDGSVVTEGV